jgi:hypothetical protein
MNHLILLDLFWLEVRNVQRPHRLQRGEDGMVERPAAIGCTQLVPDLPQRPEDARAIETLSLAMVAEAHGGSIFPR